MANTDNPHGFNVAYTLNGAPPCIKKYTVSSQTITKGDAVIHAAGLAAIALAASPALLGVATHSVASTDTELLVAVGDTNTVFEGQCSGSSAVALQGTAVDIEGTTGIMEVNEDATTEKVIQIIGLHPNDAIGANGRVYFQIVRSTFNGLEDVEA